jgi:hypothetical protein
MPKQIEIGYLQPLKLEKKRFFFYSSLFYWDFPLSKVYYVMKTLLWMFTFLPAMLLAQGTHNPTDHKKFIEVNLGDPFSKWGDFLFDKEDHMNDSYSYSFKRGSCCNAVFGNEVETVRLTFQGDKVVEINIRLKNFFEGKKLTTATEIKTATQEATTKYQTINEQFTSLFGKPYANRRKENNIQDLPLYTTQWLDKNIHLETQYYYYSPVYPTTRVIGTAEGLVEKLEEAHDKTVIVVSDVSFLKLKRKSGSF